MGRVPALDGLRGVAILLVLLFHSGLLDCGWMGVNLFFVLSGFLITQVLLPTKDLGLGFHLKRFWWRRSLRIFPLYYGFLALCLLIFLYVGLPANTFEELPYLLSYSINFRGLFTLHRESEFYNYFWSLAVEEQFYLVWPLIVFALPRKWIPKTSLAIFILSPLLRLALGEYWAEAHGNRLGIGGAMYILPFTQLDGFMVGAWLATTNWKIPRKAGKWTLALLLLAFAGLGVWGYDRLTGMGMNLHWSTFGYPIANWRLLQYVWMYSLIYLLFGVLVWWAASIQKGILIRILQWRPLRFLGWISYGLYLIHLPIQSVMIKLLPLPETYFGRILYFFPFAFLSIGFAWLSRRYVESYFLAFKSRKFLLPEEQSPDHSQVSQT